MKILLDTNAYSTMMKGHVQVQDWIRASESVTMTAPVIGELLFGFACGTREEENKSILHDFLLQPPVTFHQANMETCEVNARIGKQLKAQGTPIPTNDHWIASFAIQHNLTLLTRDRHFRHIAGLPLLTWESSCFVMVRCKEMNTPPRSDSGTGNGAPG